MYFSWAWSGSAAPAWQPPFPRLPRQVTCQGPVRSCLMEGEGLPGTASQRREGVWVVGALLCPHAGGPCPLAPTVLWAACTAAEHL